MKLTLAAVTAITGLLIADQATAAVKGYQATCVPMNPKKSSGTGSVAVTYDDATGKLCGTVSYANLSGLVDAAYIDDSVGGMLVSLSAGSSPIAIDTTINASQAAEIAKQTAYVTLVTMQFPSGEVQCTLVNDPARTTSLCKSTSMDAGTSSSGGTSSGGASSSSGSGSSSGGSSGGDGGSSGGSSGTGTEGPGSATPATPEGPHPLEDSTGCSSSGSSNRTNGVLVAAGVGLALMGLARSRRRKK
jgi:hypothetical protein